MTPTRKGEKLHITFENGVVILLGSIMRSSDGEDVLGFQAEECHLGLTARLAEQLEAQVTYWEGEVRK